MIPEPEMEDDAEAGMGTETGAETPQETVTISADLLGGVPVRNGDKLRFCATSDPDENGDVQGYFEVAEEVDEEPETEAEPKDWQEELKTVMNESEEGI